MKDNIKSVLWFIGMIVLTSCENKPMEYYEMALKSIQQNDTEKAIKYLDTVTYLDKKFHLAYAKRATIEKQLNQFDKAIDDLDEYIELGKDVYPEQYYERGVIEQKHRGFCYYIWALRDFKEAHKLDTSNNTYTDAEDELENNLVCKACAFEVVTKIEDSIFTLNRHDSVYKFSTYISMKIDSLKFNQAP